jgi:hypothetical protein
VSFAAIFRVLLFAARSPPLSTRACMTSLLRSILRHGSSVCLSQKTYLRFRYSPVFLDSQQTVMYYLVRLLYDADATIKTQNPTVQKARAASRFRFSRIPLDSHHQNKGRRKRRQQPSSSAAILLLLRYPSPLILLAVTRPSMLWFASS